MMKPRIIAAIARNYAAHAIELNNPLPKNPFFFLKPSSSIVMPTDSKQQIVLPQGIGEVHHEVELAVIIGKKASKVPESEAMDYVKGYAVAIDVTGRDLQQAAKSQGMPWAQAKGYDTFCPLSAMVDKKDVQDPQNLDLYLKINNEIKQEDSTGLMLFKVPRLIAEVSKVMTLDEGDMILTGTPKGVGRLR